MRNVYRVAKVFQDTLKENFTNTADNHTRIIVLDNTARFTVKNDRGFEVKMLVTAFEHDCVNLRVYKMMNGFQELKFSYTAKADSDELAGKIFARYFN